MLYAFNINGDHCIIYIMVGLTLFINEMMSSVYQSRQIEKIILPRVITLHHFPLLSSKNIHSNMTANKNRVHNSAPSDLLILDSTF